MLKCLCLGLTNEHYQDDTRLFGGTRPQSFPLVSAAVIFLLLGSLKERLRVPLLCDLKHQAQYNRQRLSLILQTVQLYQHCHVVQHLTLSVALSSIVLIIIHEITLYTAPEQKMHIQLNKHYAMDMYLHT